MANAASVSRNLRRSLATHLLLRLQRRGFVTAECHRPVVLHKRGSDILHDPWFNRGTAFSMTERDRLGLRGLLPPNVVSSQQQIDRFSTA